MAYSRLSNPLTEQRGQSSAVTSVLFDRGTADGLQETKSGGYVYKGDASHYHEWEFRTRLRLQGKNDQWYAQAMSAVVDGLRGEAFITAQELGLNALMQPADEFAEGLPSGLELLVKAMKLAVFPLTTHEAKELFRQYCNPSGALARQTGEASG